MLPKNTFRPSALKGIAAVILALLTTSSFRAQDITGQWNGVLSVQGIELRLVFHVSETESGYTATMDSPDQGAIGIPVTKTTYKEPTITFEVSNLNMEYQGTLADGKVEGTFRQRGMEIPMALSRDAVEIEAPNRPQEPVEPYPYVSEEVTFNNPVARISLAGTLTLPEQGGRFPAVVLITGSGPQNRNEELLGHKPFLVISDYLTRRGIAVLRYDDRGVGKSEGDFTAATSADFATDVTSAMAYLQTRPEIDPAKIGLVGHSEGGLIAPMVAAGSRDVAFIVLLAGPGIPGADILKRQTELIARANGMDEAALQTELDKLQSFLDLASGGDDPEEIRTALKARLQKDFSEHPEQVPEGKTLEEAINDNLTRLSPWMLYFLKYDPAPALEKVTCPVLALNGAKDLQVPARVNLDAIGQALEKGKNKKVTLLELPNLNHLFQECETGSPSEYAALEETFSPGALETMASWIIGHTK